MLQIRFDSIRIQFEIFPIFFFFSLMQIKIAAIVGLCNLFFASINWRTNIGWMDREKDEKEREREARSQRVSSASGWHS